MLSKGQQRLKRSFDLFVSLILLPVLIIPMLILWLFSTLSTGRDGLYRQLRIGRHGKEFKLLKFRSLKGADHVDINQIKANETAFGGWIRKYKLDELPQLINVLTGEMSLVGPRPDIPGYADKLEGQDRIVLNVRPGITGPATLKYKNEDSLLLSQPDPNEYNDTVIWPDKVRINIKYIMEWSFTRDLKYIWYSVFGGYPQTP
ncbi:sugar transferase [Aureitalea sp. L0-47]|uniref:sugar transferase n=1 Tax=Aureitalea sp. L0-47 TaxID=2816962 RepID=UPI0022375114|nr:sugar transferase [Aureitalea sp. L0-47]MCW5519203.1 sugar transferase [Aureitalea sp. L0-47]